MGAPLSRKGTMDMESVNRYLDHAVLKPEMTQEEVVAAIQLGIDYKVKTVCVKPCDIALAVEMCKGTETEVSCVLGFPHGHNTREIKKLEAEQYCKLGAQEIDMVANYGYIKSGLWDAVQAEIEDVVEVAHKANVLVKVIVESSMLDLEQVAKAAEVCVNAGADFIKTSTGFYGGGAARDVVEVMLANGNIKVKPSGGIRDNATARMYIEMGAARLGVGYTSTAVICDGGENTQTEGY